MLGLRVRQDGVQGQTDSIFGAVVHAWHHVEARPRETRARDPHRLSAGGHQQGRRGADRHQRAPFDLAAREDPARLRRHREHPATSLERGRVDLCGHPRGLRPATDGLVAARNEERGVVAGRGHTPAPGERSERGLGSRERLGIREHDLVLASIVDPDDQEPRGQAGDREDAGDGPPDRFAVVRTGLST